MAEAETFAQAPDIAFPNSLEEALSILGLYPGDARIVGGATWLMREDKQPSILVSLARIAQIDDIVEQENDWTIGPMVTHEALARHFSLKGPFRVLGQAAGASANPGVRRLATLAGNIATGDFAAADLVPALIALDASVMIAEDDGTTELTILDFLDKRMTWPGPLIITGIKIEETECLSAHARLTLRRAGEYPVAIVSLAATLSRDRRIETLRIAVGSVEQTAGRWTQLEKQLIGQTFDLGEIETAAKDNLGAFSARDGADAPSWYRLEILPHLVRTAFAEIEKQAQG
ncbi:MAG: molybdopterin dehydrogenase [Rhizobiaceae bacterium MnEN-MB40S]|nr:MAG: molybdopterin dehydrogenase [Rhizobiaceae bacterium MnEN-MB40S]